MKYLSFFGSAAAIALGLVACGGSGDDGDLFAPTNTGGTAGSDANAGGSSAGTAGAGTGGTGQFLGGGGTAGAAGASAGSGGTGTAGTGNGGTGGTGTAGTGGTGTAGTGTGGTAGSSGSGTAGSAGFVCALDPPSSGLSDVGWCVQTGAPGYPCNPVTNQGCGAGQACDFDGKAFKCFGGSNTVQACGACDSSAGPFCAPGYTCWGGHQQCTHYCCANSDCGSGGFCVKQKPSSVGICQAKNGMQLADFSPGTGGSGTGGSGTGGSGAGGAGPGGKGGTGGTAGKGGTGGSGGATTCAHSPCVEGAALSEACDPCVQLACAFSPACCSSKWDATCVSTATSFCTCN